MTNEAKDRVKEVEARSKKKHGSVCSDCGRTVTEAEYSGGQSVCCDAEVCGEEFYGK